MRERRGLRNNILVLIAGLFIALLLAEAALRAAGYSSPKFYAPDKYAGYRHRPGVAGWYRQENKTYIRINRRGLRDREHSLEKPPGAARIAVLGDSYAEALHVPMENAFWAVMEDRLKGCDGLKGRRPEAINFGVGGYGTAQELMTFRRYARAYSPDLVLLAFLSGNDVKDNHPEFNKLENMRPFFRVENGALVPDFSFRSSPRYVKNSSRLYRMFYAFMDRSRLAQLAEEARLNLKSKKTRKINEENMRGLIEENRNEFSMIYGEPRIKEWREAWEVTERLILQMSREARSGGAEFLVVVLSNPVQVAPDSEAGAGEKGTFDFYYPERRIEKLGGEGGFSVLTLAPAFKKYADEHNVFLHGPENNPGTGHWTKFAHRLAGEMIAEKICDENLLGGK